MTRTEEHYIPSSSVVRLTFTTARVANIRPTGNPAITGTAKVGETLTADVSSIKDANNKEEDTDPGDILSSAFSYTWWKEVDFGPHAGTVQQISGATGSTYTLKKEDARAKLKVKVRYTDDADYSAELESGWTATVASIDDTAPHVVSLALRGDRQDFVNQGGDFEVLAGDLISVCCLYE